MLKYIKWICLSISIIAICALSFIFIKNNSKTKKIEEDNFKISNIQNVPWYKIKEEIYENNTLINKVNLIDSEYITFLDNQIQYTKPLTNQINSYKYEYKNGNLTIYEAKSFLLSGTYNIKLENEELILTQKENDIINIYYFTKAVG